MSDRRPDRVYGILVRAGRVFVGRYEGGEGLPGGEFRPLADHRKHELTAQLWDELGIWAEKIWAQGAFDYCHPTESREWFSGFYSVWDWQGEIPPGAGRWLDDEGVAASELPASLRILLLSVLNTAAVRTT